MNLHAEQTVTIGSATAASGTPLYSKRNGTLLSGSTYYGARFESTAGMGVTLGYDDQAAVGTMSSVGASTGLGFWTHGGAWAERLRIAPGGNIGIGTPSPGSLLDIAGGTAEVMLRLRHTGTGGVKQRLVSADGEENRYQATHFSAYTGEIAVKNVMADLNQNSIQFRVLGQSDSNSEAGLAAAIRMTILGSGNVGIGTTSPTARLDVNGDIKASGVIHAKFQDIAEWVPSTEPIAAGTVVVVAAQNHVTASTRAYDTSVAGVVSPKPGLVLGDEGESKVLVATTGRVKVRVDASNGPIREGDILVSSTIKGTAMKSLPLDVAGAQFHRPGTIIGKALEPLEKGTGEILVLLSLQ